MHQFLNQPTIPIPDKTLISNNILKVIHRENFRNYIIAQDDDNDYSESGYFVVKVEDNYGLSRYSHCSCFGTWTSFSENNMDFLWVGTEKDLIYLAETNSDPSFPGRKADEKDYDYEHLMEVYKQVLEYFKNN